MAQNTLPHSVLSVNPKETSSKPTFRMWRHKPVTPVKVDRLNFLLNGYNASLLLYLVTGFTFVFGVGFVEERRASQSPNLKSALEQPQVVHHKKCVKSARPGESLVLSSVPLFRNLFVPLWSLSPKKTLQNFV